MPFVNRTRATLRRAEFGVFGVCVKTRTHTPRFCGLLCKAGLFVLLSTASRPFLTSWLIVGIVARTQNEPGPAKLTHRRVTPRHDGISPLVRALVRFRPRSRTLGA